MRSLIMLTCASDAAARCRARGVAVLLAWVAELEARNEVRAAQLAVRDAQLEAAQGRLAVLAEQIEELRRRLHRQKPQHGSHSGNDMIPETEHGLAVSETCRFPGSIRRDG
jgi:hypothetical protein